MTQTKTPPPSSPPVYETPSPSSFGDSSLLDLDDPNITDSLLDNLNDTSAELLLEGVVAPTGTSLQYASEALAPTESNESSFAQLWETLAAEDEAQTHSQQHHASDYFSAWQEAAQHHHLPTAVELLPPVIPPLLNEEEAEEEEEYDEEEASESPPTGLFLADDAPLFFVDEHWAPAENPHPELVSQNPFEESVAVLKELSFQHHAQQAPQEHFALPSSSSQAFLPSEFLTYLPPPEPEITPPPPVAFSEDALASENVSAPPELQNTLWLVDESEEEIILLEDELPPDEMEMTPAPVEVYNLAPPPESFPPKIAPVASSTPVPSLLSPAIFFDAWPEPAQPPLNTAPANLYLQGHHEVILYMLSGAVKRGTLQDADLSQPHVLLQTPEESEQIAVQHIKAVYFLKPGHGPLPPPPTTDAYWNVVFSDGRRVEGQLSQTQEDAEGFFLFPRQEKSPTACLYINRSAVQEISGVAL